MLNNPFMMGGASRYYPQQQQPYTSPTAATAPNLAAQQFNKPAVNPYIAGVGTLAASLIPLLFAKGMNKTPLLAAALGNGVQAFAGSKAYNAQAQNFQNYRGQLAKAFGKDPNIASMLNSANSPEEANNIIEKIMPQYGNYNAGQGLVSQLNGAPNSQAFPNGQYADPTHMQAVQKTQMDALNNGQIDPRLNYSSGQYAPNYNPGQQGPQQNNVGGGYVPMNAAQENKVNVSGVNPYADQQWSRSMPAMTYGQSTGQQTAQTSNGYQVASPAMQQAIMEKMGQQNNGQNIPNNTTSNNMGNAGTQPNGVGGFNPLSYAQQPGYYNKAQEAQFKQNPYTNMQANEALQTAIGKQQTNNAPTPTVASTTPLLQSLGLISPTQAKALMVNPNIPFKVDEAVKLMGITDARQKNAIQNYVAQTGRINSGTQQQNANTNATNANTNMTRAQIYAQATNSNIQKNNAQIYKMQHPEDANVGIQKDVTYIRDEKTGDVLKQSTSTIKTTTKGNSSSNQNNQGTVQIKSGDGKIWTIPQNKLQDALKRGAKQL